MTGKICFNAWRKASWGEKWWVQIKKQYFNMYYAYCVKARSKDNKFLKHLSFLVDMSYRV